MSTNPRRLSWMDEIHRVHLSPSTSSDALALPCSIKIMWNRLIDGFDERASERGANLSSSYEEKLQHQQERCKKPKVSIKPRPRLCVCRGGQASVGSLLIIIWKYFILIPLSCSIIIYTKDDANTKRIAHWRWVKNLGAQEVERSKRVKNALGAPSYDVGKW